jgi:hypothetical protein
MLMTMRLQIQLAAKLACGLIGALLLLWTAGSYFISIGGQVPLPLVVGVNVNCVSGLLDCMVIQRAPADSPLLPFSADFGCSRVSNLTNSLPPSTATDMTIHPAMFQWNRTVAHHGAYASMNVAAPTWLLALVFLLWPAVSFLRREVRPQRPMMPRG